MPHHPSSTPKILLIIKSPDFKTVKRAARDHDLYVFDIAKNGGNLGEFRAMTDAGNRDAVTHWFAEDPPCVKGQGFPPGTLLFFREVMP